MTPDTAANLPRENRREAIRTARHETADRTLAHAVAALLLPLALAGGDAVAQTWPAKPVRIVVGFPPGGTNDLLARILAPKLGEALSQQVVVDNRGGANSIIGTELVARSPADGYTLLLNSVVMAINPGLYRKLAHDPVADFAPIIRIAAGQLVLVVHPSLPARSVKELIALGRARPDELSYASSGSGGSPHLAMELLNATSGIKMVHVPYKGTGPAFSDLLGGQVPIMFSPIVPVVPHVRSNRLRALAIGGAQRTAALPQTPTVAEAALPGFEASAWFGMFAPARTPREIVDRLNAELGRILTQPDIREKLVAQGADPLGGSPEALGDYLRQELVKWARVVAVSGARAD
jgi:tripartite-type tricarboxylate transporter receptor subunit TctC